jgi:nitric oxide reductase large subunit
LLFGAALAPGVFDAVVVGVVLGGVISVCVVWRELGPIAEGKGPPSRDPATFAMAMRRVAAIYLAFALPLFVVAVFMGGVAPIVVTALNLGLGLLGFVVVRHRLGAMSGERPDCVGSRDQRR